MSPEEKRLALDALIEPKDLQTVLAAPLPEHLRNYDPAIVRWQTFNPFWMLPGRSASWIGRPELAAVSQQLPYATCLAHALCRLQETLVALNNRDVSLDPELFHQCIGGLNCNMGQSRPDRHVRLMWDVGGPFAGSGFEPDQPCPVNLPPTSRCNGARLISDAATAKQAIAREAPVVAVISAEARFGLVRDFEIYRDGGGPADLHHALLLVGYDDDAKCWEVQNSFGTGWGRGGHGRIAYGHCAILRDGRHPVFALN